MSSFYLTIQKGAIRDQRFDMVSISFADSVVDMDSERSAPLSTAHLTTLVQIFSNMDRVRRVFYRIPFHLMYYQTSVRSCTSCYHGAARRPQTAQEITA